MTSDQLSFWLAAKAEVKVKRRTFQPSSRDKWNDEAVGLVMWCVCLLWNADECVIWTKELRCDAASELCRQVESLLFVQLQTTACLRGQVLTRLQRERGDWSLQDRQSFYCISPQVRPTCAALHCCSRNEELLHYSLAVFTVIVPTTKFQLTKSQMNAQDPESP